MSFTLVDRESGADLLHANSWHWHAIVEVVRSLGVLPAETVDELHIGCSGLGLTRTEARAVAAALRAQLLPGVAADERILLDGSRTTVPDDGTFHREPDTLHLNYGTDRATLERFAAAIEGSGGFTVM